jgi:predicted Zn-dependent protease
MRLHLGIALLTAWTLNAQAPLRLQKELAVGAELARNYRLGHAPLDSVAVRDYIEQMGRRLVAAMPDEPPFAYQFGATTDFTGTFLEPTSFPAGYVFVPAGLILEARDEGEFAGLLAHAIAHISLWHNEPGSRNVQPGTIPIFFLWNSGEAGALVPAANGAYEPQADRLAVQLAASAGYDPSGLARYIARVQPAATVGYSARDARVQAMRDEIQAPPQQDYASSTDFARIQQEVRQLAPPPPAPPKQPTLQR